MDYKSIDDLLKIAKEAGERIMEIYDDPEFASVVDIKADNSPLTLADKASHKVVTKGLKRLYPNIPVLSEEDQKQVDYSTRVKWDKYWLVDPLDGTKEFIKRNGEFTVNIALIDNRKPVLGIIYVPEKEIYYYGEKSTGAYKKVRHQLPETIMVGNNLNNRTAVRSRSHSSDEEDAVMKRFGVNDFVSVGSSLKFCIVAEGGADLYYRHGPTMEWDTAAGQAIVEAAGGSVYMGADTIDPFLYNKENLLNGSFLCLGFDH